MQWYRRDSGLLTLDHYGIGGLDAQSAIAEAERILDVARTISRPGAPIHPSSPALPWTPFIEYIWRPKLFNAVAYGTSTSFAEGDTGTNISGVAKPASTAIDEFLLGICYKESTAAASTFTSTGDTWIQIHEIDNITPTPDFRFTAAYCIVANATSTIGISGTNIGWRDCAIFRFTGVDTTTPLDVTSTENQGSSTTPTGLGLASGTAGRHLVLCLSDFDGRTHASWTSPLTERNDSGNVAMASGEDTAGNDTANKSATITTSPWAAIMLALRPAGGGPPADAVPQAWAQYRRRMGF